MAEDPLLLDRMKNKLYNSVTRYPNLLEWLHVSQKIRLDDEQQLRVTLSAAEAGNIEVLQWLKKKKFPVSEDALLLALEKGHLDAANFFCVSYKPFKWKKDLASEIAEKRLLASVSSGKLEMVKFGIRWRAEFARPFSVMHAAAMTGNISVMSYLHEKSFPLDDYAIACATASGNIAALEWVLQKIRNEDLCSLCCARLLVPLLSSFFPPLPSLPFPFS